MFKDTVSIENYIQKNNEENPHVKLFPIYVNEELIEISVRFFWPSAVEEYIPDEVEEAIYQKIIRLSRRRMFPARNGLFKYGVLELKTSHIHRYTMREDYIRPLEYVTKQMVDEIFQKNVIANEIN